MRADTLSTMPMATMAFDPRLLQQFREQSAQRHASKGARVPSPHPPSLPQPLPPCALALSAQCPQPRHPSPRHPSPRHPSPLDMGCDPADGGGGPWRVARGALGADRAESDCALETAWQGERLAHGFAALLTLALALAAEFSRAPRSRAVALALVALALTLDAAAARRTSVVLVATAAAAALGTVDLVASALIATVATVALGVERAFGVRCLLVYFTAAYLTQDMSEARALAVWLPTGLWLLSCWLDGCAPVPFVVLVWARTAAMLVALGTSGLLLKA